MDEALAIIEAEIDHLESLVAGLHHAAQLLRDDVDDVRLVTEIEEDEGEDDQVECEDCGEMFHRQGIGPHRRAHRRQERTAGIAVFDPDAARAAAAMAS